MNPDHDKFMAIAIEEARLGAAAGEQPFGAVVTLNGEEVVRARSLKVATSDCTAHSETLAIKYATQKLQQRSLPEGSVFYCTCEPCPMCLGAVLNGGIKTIVVGARNAQIKNTAPLAFNFGDYSIETFSKMVGWDLTIIEGIRNEECVALYSGAKVPLTR